MCAYFFVCVSLSLSAFLLHPLPVVLLQTAAALFKKNKIQANAKCESK